MERHVLIFGLVGGLLIATLQYTEYRFVIIEHSVELYSAVVAILFATFGIWLGLRIARSRETIRETSRETIRETVVVREAPVPAQAPALEPFAPNTAHQQTLGITARELETLTLVARGFRGHLKKGNFMYAKARRRNKSERFNQFLQWVTTLRAIAAELNDRAVDAPRGGQWSGVQVQRVLVRA
ncbi:hypothetical protein [Acidipila rosea]|uniref:Uncharacterized protein n=1 Tax=Acidipila rosea TaxID=768535 RepID=A0A4R1L5K9_9BACT|nr:hypothetical protein [Acidipila rosea]TCK72457.1 hypothetical protein C7378_2034 [Acidipila rosea]